MAPAAPAAPKAAPASMDPMAFLGDLPLPEGDAPLLVGENPSDLSAFLPDDDLGVATGLSAGSASPSFPMDDRGAGRAALPPGPAAKPKSSVDEKSMKELVELHCGRAFEHMRKGAYEESIQEYRRALEYDPDYLPALNNLAIVYEKKPSWHAQAILHWEKVERLSATKGDPKHVERARKHLDNLRKMNEG
jgi:tetratricopeptide (TPR) repeat protein